MDSSNIDSNLQVQVARKPANHDRSPPLPSKPTSSTRAQAQVSQTSKNTMILGSLLADLDLDHNGHSCHCDSGTNAQDDCAQGDDVGDLAHSSTHADLKRPRLTSASVSAHHSRPLNRLPPFPFDGDPPPPPSSRMLASTRATPQLESSPDLFVHHHSVTPNRSTSSPTLFVEDDHAMMDDDDDDDDDDLGDSGNRHREASLLFHRTQSMHLASTYFADGHLAHASVPLVHSHSHPIHSSSLAADEHLPVIPLTPPDAAHLSPRAATQLALWRPWLLLTLAMSVTGSFWAFDLPGQLNIPLGERFGFSPDEWQLPFGRLYAVYALPNILMPFIAGRLVDRYGPRAIHVALLAFVVLGQGLVTWGIRQVSYAEVVVGRFLLGVGGESLSVAQARITCDWFLESELGFALGFHLAFARMGSVLNDLFSASIESTSGATSSSASALSVCIASMLFGMIACLIDAYKRPAISESDLIHLDHHDDDEASRLDASDDWRTATGDFKPTLSPLPEHAPLSPIESPNYDHQPSRIAEEPSLVCDTRESTESTPLLAENRGGSDGSGASRMLSASYSGTSNPPVTSPYRRARVSSLTPSYRSLSGGSLLDSYHLHHPVVPLIAPTTTLVRRRSMSILVDVKDLAGSGADQMGLAAVAAASHAGASAAAAANSEIQPNNSGRPPSVSAGSIFAPAPGPDATIVLGFTPRPSLSATPSIMTLPLTAAHLDSDDPDGASSAKRHTPFVLFTFPLSFWALTVSMVSLYVSCNTFTSISSDFLQSKYGMDATQAGKMNSLMDTMATVVVPASGLLFERLPRWGQRMAVVVNAAGLSLAFCGLAYWQSIEYLYCALGLLGSAYAIGASMLWPLIPILVRDPSTLSTAYGVVTCGVNGMLAIVPAFFAGLIAADPTFTTTMLTFSAIAGVGAVAAMMT